MIRRPAAPHPPGGRWKEKHSTIHPIHITLDMEPGENDDNQGEIFPAPVLRPPPPARTAPGVPKERFLSFLQKMHFKV
jgi:hypothetical protein